MTTKTPSMGLTRTTHDLQGFKFEEEVEPEILGRKLLIEEALNWLRIPIHELFVHRMNR